MKQGENKRVATTGMFTTPKHNNSKSMSKTITTQNGRAGLTLPAPDIKSLQTDMKYLQETVKNQGENLMNAFEMLLNEVLNLKEMIISSPEHLETLPDDETMPEYLDKKEAGKLLGYSESWVNANLKNLPYQKLNGRLVRFNKDELLAYRETILKRKSA